MASGPGAPWRRFLLAGLIAAGLIGLLYWLFADRLSSNQDMRLVYMGGFLVLLLAGLIGRFQTTPLSSWGKSLGQLVFWGAMVLLLIGGYSYRGQLRPFADRILGELDPSRPQVESSLSPTSSSASFTMADDGQFHIRADIGGVPVSFILDTGASDVMLRPADARRLGFDPASLAYTRTYETANGTVEGAPVTLPAIDIGLIHLTDVAASVSQSDSGSSLLGMSFLSRLSSFHIEGPKLTLVQ
jgi:aspartyl protease family protein